MSNIPEARRRLAVLEQHVLKELKQIRALMTRPAPVRRAKERAARCTPEMAEEIRRYARAHPETSFRKIGNKFKVDSGRVSEAIRELR